MLAHICQSLAPFVAKSSYQLAATRHYFVHGSFDTDLECTYTRIGDTMTPEPRRTKGCAMYSTSVLLPGTVLANQMAFIGLASNRLPGAYLALFSISPVFTPALQILDPAHWWRILLASPRGQQLETREDSSGLRAGWSALYLLLPIWSRMKGWLQLRHWHVPS